MSFSWFKKNKNSAKRESGQEYVSEQHAASDVSSPTEKVGYFEKLKQGLNKTRSGLGSLFTGKQSISPETLEILETELLCADIGMETTTALIDNMSSRISRHEIEDVGSMRRHLAEEMVNYLAPYEKPLNIEDYKPYVMLMIGINGAGKTTTIGKLANRFKTQGKRVMLAAGDTFRAAAVEQLKAWGERHDVPVIAQETGADSASVAFDAVNAAKARNIDVLIIDTAGRLHTQEHLMDELRKIKRVLQKIDAHIPHETMLILDAGNGQNALRQALHFHKAMSIDSISLTKLDGTAKGGIIFAITQSLQLPIRFIGVGEQASDLQPFNAQAFVDALLCVEN